MNVKRINIKNKIINEAITKAKRHKVNSDETIRQQRDILYSNPHKTAK